MKPLSQRERVMVTALPAAVILLGYFFFVAGPLGKEGDRLRREAEKARPRVPTLQQEVDMEVKLRALETEAKVFATAAQALKEREEALLTHWGDQDSKSRAGELVGDLLTANGIVLIEEAVADEQDLQRFGTALARLPAAELWKLRIAGGFLQVATALSGLGDTDLPVLPVAIEMESLAEGNRNVHLWSLWICR